MLYVVTHADIILKNLDDDDVKNYINKTISELEVIEKNDNKIIVIWSDSEGQYLHPFDNTVHT